MRNEDESNTLSPPAISVSESGVRFQSCRFKALSLPEVDPGDWMDRGMQRLMGGLLFEGMNTTVVMTNCTIENPRQDWPISLNGKASFFADNSNLKVV